MTEFEKLNPPREDGYPKVKEIRSGVQVKVDVKNPDYDKPISKLKK
jgi:hypothetical protein